MWSRASRTALAVLLAAVSMFAPPLLVDGADLTAPVPGGLQKPTTIEISPPWAMGVEHAITQAYGTGSHLGTDRACCNNDHYALDFDLQLNEPVFPVAAGNVLYAGPTGGPSLGYGSIVVVGHPNGYQSLYAHLESIAVTTGTAVGIDDSLGGAGGSGGWPVHLHFALYKNAAFGPSPLGLGIHGGNAVVPEPFVSCSKANSATCENFAKGDHLIKQDRVALFNLNKGPVQLRWDGAPDANAFQLRVVPLGGDGPGVDLVISDPRAVAKRGFTLLPPVLGQGNYVLLPGATYRWQVRFSPLGVGVGDTAWGAWSSVQEFRTAVPNARSIGLTVSVDGGDVSMPTIRWLDIEVADFLYEIQLSVDPQFQTGPAAVAPVYWVLVHGGMAKPVNSWTVPPGYALSPGLYAVRIRQRLQATAAGLEERGLQWSAALFFNVPAAYAAGLVSP